MQGFKVDLFCLVPEANLSANFPRRLGTITGNNFDLNAGTETGFNGGGDIVPQGVNNRKKTKPYQVPFDFGDFKMLEIPRGR